MDDVYIRVLKFAKNNPGFTIEDFRKKFPNDISWIEREYQFNKLFQTDLDTQKIYLSFEDRFRLLEHEELIDARKISKRAMRIAISSILLTLASIVYQYVVVSSVKIVNFSDIANVNQEMHSKALNLDSEKGVRSE